jgi:hypothetical protein
MKRVGFAVVTVAAVLIASPAVRGQARNEGIVVHGHWTLEVVNRDGSVAERREFENALTNNGAAFLAEVLARDRSVGRWEISLTATDTRADMFDGFRVGRIVEPGVTGGRSYYNNLTLAAVNLQSLTLIGTATPNRPGAVGMVATDVVSTCLTEACTNRYGTNGSVFQFTSTTVKNAAGVLTPITLVADQSLRVTVAISFSSPAGS